MRNKNGRFNTMSEMPKLLAVRGYMRSGTNWVCNLLNLHPDVQCVGEFHWQRVIEVVRSNLERLDGCVDLDRLRVIAMARFNETIRDVIVEANGGDTRFVGDRTPTMIDHEVLPDAHYFDVVRDGRDVLVSRAYHVFRLPSSYPPFENDPAMREVLAEFDEDRQLFFKHPEKLLANRRFVRGTARQWSKFVRHNESVVEAHPELKVMRVRYDQIHRNTEETREEMYRFLGLDPGLAEPLGQRTSAGFEKERPRNLYRKGIVGDWKNYFNDQAKAWFLEGAGDTLERLGYATDDQWSGDI